MFEKKYQPICPDSPDIAQAALLPWDIETFGFGVADIEIDTEKLTSADIPKLKQNIKNYADSNNVELIGVNFNFSDKKQTSLCQLLGFQYIETFLNLKYENLDPIIALDQPVTLHKTQEHELEKIANIAEQSFNFGKYHSDPNFPKELANKRYRQWVIRSFSSQTEQILLFADIDNTPASFAVIQIDGTKGYLHLNAIAPEMKGQKLGKRSMVAVLKYFKEKGVKEVHSKISAANTAALNMHASLGAKFFDPQVLFHWHNPDSNNLLDTIT